MPVILQRDMNSLLDLLYDGFYVVFLLKDGSYRPGNAETFRERIKQYITTFERGAKNFAQASADDIYLCKFAFAALLDETVLATQPSIRDSWEVRPFQLEQFGEQLAGERFFDHLEKLREERQPRVQVLEVFHMCLLLGFQGKYITEGSEKLHYFTSRLGEEIAHLKGRRASFAPHALPPDQIIHKLRNEVPLWVIVSTFAFVAMLAFMVLRWSLQHQTQRDLVSNSNLIQLAPQPATVIITLP